MSELYNNYGKKVPNREKYLHSYKQRQEIETMERI